MGLSTSSRSIVLFWLLVVSLTYCGHCVNEEEFNVIKEENEDLKTELKQMKIRMNRMENMTSQLGDDVKVLKRSDADVVKRVKDLETAATGTLKVNVCIFISCSLQFQNVKQVTHSTYLHPR